jgi:hypothetical protein
MDDKYGRLIEEEFRDCVKNTIVRLSKEDTRKPFHEALLSKEVLVWSRFERSFSTSFGQKSIENISMYAALSGGASNAERQRKTNVDIDEAVISSIEGIIAKNRNKQPSNWEDSLAEVTSVKKKGKLQTVRVITDLWWEKDGVENYMSIKTVQPNIDQTGVAKKDCLILKSNNLKCNVYFGLYYNPFGDNRRDYSFGIPMNIFDMHRDEVVLIGRDYWEKLGGPGFYDEILEIAKGVGEETRGMISEYASGQSDLGRF